MPPWTHSQITSQSARNHLVEIAPHLEDVPVEVPALLIAAEEAPPVDLQGALITLDELAATIEETCPHAGTPLEQMGEIAAGLFGPSGFQGNREHYYDPRNSLLPSVLERRTGIPITLALVAIAVARRLDIRLQGVGFPYHFLVTHEERQDFFIDGFNGGRLLSVADCRDKLKRMSGGHVDFDRALLEPISNRDLLVRMLCNLKDIHMREEAYERAICVTERILLLAPERLGELRDRGLLHLKSGAYRLAVDALSAYLDRVEHAPDRDLVAHQLTRAKARLRTLH